MQMLEMQKNIILVNTNRVGDDYKNRTETASPQQSLWYVCHAAVHASRGVCQIVSNSWSLYQLSGRKKLKQHTHRDL